MELLYLEDVLWLHVPSCSHFKVKCLFPVFHKVHASRFCRYHNSEILNDIFIKMLRISVLFFHSGLFLILAKDSVWITNFFCLVDWIFPAMSSTY